MDAVKERTKKQRRELKQRLINEVRLLGRVELSALVKAFKVSPQAIGRMLGSIPEIIIDYRETCGPREKRITYYWRDGCEFCRQS